MPKPGAIIGSAIVMAQVCNAAEQVEQMRRLEIASDVGAIIRLLKTVGKSSVQKKLAQTEKARKSRFSICNCNSYI